MGKNFEMLNSVFWLFSIQPYSDPVEKISTYFPFKVTTAAPECVEFEFTVRLIRSCKFDQVSLIVGDDKNRVIFKTVLS